MSATTSLLMELIVQQTSQLQTYRWSSVDDSDRGNSNIGEWIVVAAAATTMIHLASNHGGWIVQENAEIVVCYDDSIMDHPSIYRSLKKFKKNSK